MKLDFAVSASILLALLFIGTVGAFLFFVPALSVLSVSMVVLGLGLMFALGLLTGRRWRKIARGQRTAYLFGKLHAYKVPSTHVRTY